MIDIIQNYAKIKLSEVIHNNLKGKAMQVETFECSEVAEETVEMSQEAIELMEKLGCKGQLNLVSKKDNKEIRSPYREMTEEERFVYKTMCPDRKKLSEYSQSPIPLRVLQIASHVQSLEIPEMKYLYVWDKVSAEVKDPVLVATDNESEWNIKKTFILARWGEELETFSTLLKRAAKIKRDELVAQAKSAMQLAKNAVDNIASMSDAEMVKAGTINIYGPGIK